MAQQAYEGLFHEEPAIWLRSGDYEAAVLPGVGANLIAFRDTARQHHYLREPAAEEMEAFKALPYVHGIPVLFPPNRFEDGKFRWEGKTYQFPVNEAATGNHLHGFVYGLPWTVEGFGADELESRVTLSLTIDEQHEVYRHFPHAFTIRLQYTLSGDGLYQRVQVRNNGETRMPCLMAFHTTINAPFAPGSVAEDCTFKVTVGERWELSDRLLPTGRFQEKSEQERRLAEGGLSPFFEEMDNHYQAVPQDGRNRMELLDSRAGLKLVYDVGTAYKQWMIWNNKATPGFFCPEPQMNLVNAPNGPELPAEEIGLIGLGQGELWEETSRLYLIEQG